MILSKDISGNGSSISRVDKDLTVLCILKDKGHCALSTLNLLTLKDGKFYPIVEVM